MITEAKRLVYNLPNGHVILIWLRWMYVDLNVPASFFYTYPYLITTML